MAGDKPPKTTDAIDALIQSLDFDRLAEALRISEIPISRATTIQDGAASDSWPAVCVGTSCWCVAEEVGETFRVEGQAMGGGGRIDPVGDEGLVALDDGHLVLVVDGLVHESSVVHEDDLVPSPPSKTNRFSSTPSNSRSVISADSSSATSRRIAPLLVSPNSILPPTGTQNRCCFVGSKSSMASSRPSFANTQMALTRHAE